MNVCMRYSKQTNMVIISQANLIPLACYGNVAIFSAALLCPREMLLILVPVPQASGAVLGSHWAEQAGGVVRRIEEGRGCLF